MVMTVLHPTYTIRLEIQDPAEVQQWTSDQPERKLQKYFSGLDHKTGCDEVMAEVEKALKGAGIRHFSLWLDRFEHKALSFHGANR